MADDFILRQIRGMSEFMGAIISGSDPQKEQHIPEEEQNGDTIGINVYKRILLRFLSENQINEAETQLFTWLENNEFTEKRTLTLWFYDILRHFSDTELVAGSFSAEEIEKGEKDALGIIAGYTGE